MIIWSLSNTVLILFSTSISGFLPQISDKYPFITIGGDIYFSFEFQKFQLIMVRKEWKGEKLT